MDRYVINKESNMLIVESKSWVYGCSLHSSFNFSVTFENVHNKILGEKNLSTKKAPTNQPTNKSIK